MGGTIWIHMVQIHDKPWDLGVPQFQNVPDKPKWGYDMMGYTCTHVHGHKSS